MSPVGRLPESDRPMRAYSGKPQPLGALSEWSCPGCGQKNTSKFEEGCVHCGAGKPGAKVDLVKVERETQRVVEAPQRGVVQAPNPAAVASPVSPVESSKIYRLIEYDIRDMRGAIGTLQRSLVGKVDLAWGTITAAIVDSVDLRQADLLKVAARQPGIWIANPMAMQGLTKAQLLKQTQLTGFDSRQAGRAPEDPTGSGEREVAPPPGTNPFEEAAQRREMAEPITPNVLDQNLASALYGILGFQGCYTLALSLQMFAEQADQGSLEPGKTWDQANCLRLAQALMDLVPADWNPEPAAGDDEAPPQPTIRQE